MTRKQLWIGLGVLCVILLIAAFQNTRVWHRYAFLGEDDSVSQTAGSGTPGSLYATANSVPMAVRDGDMASVEEAEMMKSSLYPMPPMESGSVAVDVAPEDRLIVKNGSMSLVVDSVEASVDAIKQFAFAHGGFVVTSNIDDYSNRPSGYMHIRIPSDVFDSGLEDIRALGDVQSERVDGRDVTEEFVDLEAQLQNYQATEAQFLEIMQQATEIEDILAVQRELMNVRSTIERLEGRMKYLQESAAFSSLTVYLSTDPEQLPVLDNTDEWKPLATIKQALRDLLELGKAVLDAIIWVIIFIPLWIVLYVLYRIGKRIYLRQMQK